MNNDERVCFTGILKKFDADQLFIERDRLGFEREKCNNEIRHYHEERKNRRAQAEKDRAGGERSKKTSIKRNYKIQDYGGHTSTKRVDII